jgi:hypothetical protein
LVVSAHLDRAPSRNDLALMNLRQANPRRQGDIGEAAAICN